ncbi:MAG: hypothetical protein V3U72_00780 [Candidatus Aenigmarchaeota archaeon]
MLEIINEYYIGKMTNYFSEKIIWKKEVDPNMGIKAGTMDCTRWVPENPWWNGELVEQEKTGIRYKSTFEIPKGETPVMGRNYVEITPFRTSDRLTICALEINEKMKKYKQNFKNYWQGKILPVLRRL